MLLLARGGEEWGGRKVIYRGGESFLALEVRHAAGAVSGRFSVRRASALTVIQGRWNGQRKRGPKFDSLRTRFQVSSESINSFFPPAASAPARSRPGTRRTDRRSN